jgi:hypothetical protein
LITLLIQCKKLKHYRLIQLSKQNVESAGMTRSIACDLPCHGIDIDLGEVYVAYRNIAVSRRCTEVDNMDRSTVRMKKASGFKKLMSGFKGSSQHNVAAA